MNRIDIRDAHLCGVCADVCLVLRGANGNYRHVFFCGECELRRAKMVANMSGIGLKTLQGQSLLDASPRIGAFLDKIGKTDTVQMTEIEWMQFLDVVIREYSASMRKLTDAPF